MYINLPRAAGGDARQHEKPLIQEKEPEDFFMEPEQELQ